MILKVDFALKLSKYIIKTFYMSQMNPKVFSPHSQFYYTLPVTPFKWSAKVEFLHQGLYKNWPKHYINPSSRMDGHQK